MLKIGTRIYAKWQNGAFYPGKIKEIDPGQGLYKVAFDDGDEGTYSLAEIVFEPSALMERISDLETTCELLRADVEKLNAYTFGNDLPAGRPSSKDGVGILVERSKLNPQRAVDAQTAVATYGKGRV